MPLKKQKKVKIKNTGSPPMAESRAEIIYLEHIKTGLSATSDYPELLLESLRAIISTLEEKDLYTHGHSIRVAEYALIMGQELGLHEQELKELELAAILHDIGKIGIPDSVLMKPGRLSKAEFEIMKSHPARTAKVLEKISALHTIIPGVKYHHERWDGLGYPEGLVGESIPLFARIILIADTYDAMTSTRPYRLALHKEVAFTELRKCSGTQFDPELVNHFIRGMESRTATKSRKRKGVTRRIA